MIHIVGSIGSGKKGIENRLRKEDNLLVINLNDIEDFHFVNAMKTNKKCYNMVANNKQKIWRNDFEKGVEKIFNQYVKLANKEKKVLVVMNIANIENQFPFLNKMSFENKFYIGIDIEELFRTSCSKIISRIKSNHHEINEMYKYQPKLHIIKPITYYRMRIKDWAIQPFDEFERVEKDKRKWYCKKGYKIKCPSDIVDKITTKFTKNGTL